MKKCIRLATFVLGAFAAHWAYAQTAPDNRPVDATGLCKDGTYSTDVSRSGACRGHHGVKEWYTSPEPPPTSSGPESAQPTPPPPPAAEAPSPTTQVRTQSQEAAKSAGQSGVPPPTQSIKEGPAANAADASAAPGGGPDRVWLNPGSHIYHCPGSRFYGKTKKGAYMTEDEAKAKGAHRAPGEVCKQ